MSIVASTTSSEEILTDEVDRLAITTLRFLAADAVQAANSGHPGLPLGAAPAAWVLWSRHLRHDPAQPRWPDRDRFVLSAGHGSALLYALLHFFGYDLSLDELGQFRQLGSRTPGHPEFGLTPGVETTTGPLGQGLANAVGMALAERMLAARCNDGEYRVVDHRTWVLAGDGDLMEGISHEAASLAGRLGLGRLTVVFDDNNITIDGPAELSCGDDALGRFAAYGWHTLSVEDGNDVAAIDQALAEARAVESAPTFIKLRTTIGYGAPGVEGTSKVHGSPLGTETIAAMRAKFDWPSTAFYVPPNLRSVTAALAADGAAVRAEWIRWLRQLDCRSSAAGRRLPARSGSRAAQHRCSCTADRFVNTGSARDAPGVGRGAERSRPRIPCSRGRIGRPGGIDQHRDTRRGREGRRLCRSHHSLRYPRARDGRGLQRHLGARGPAPVRQHVPGLLRLPAPGAALVCADGAAGDLCVYA
jgi:transketolase